MKTMIKNELITIKTFPELVDAEIFKAMLESNDIECVLEDAEIVAVNPLYSNMVGGIKIKIKPEDVERVETIIKEVKDVKPGSVGVEVENTSAEEKGSCPNCGSKNIAKERVFRRAFGVGALFGFSVLILSLPLLLLSKRRNFCFDCKHKWKSNIKK